jgi:hypothetical protein
MMEVRLFFQMSGLMPAYSEQESKEFHEEKTSDQVSLLAFVVGIEAVGGVADMVKVVRMFVLKLWRLGLY